MKTGKWLILIAAISSSAMALATPDKLDLTMSLCVNTASSSVRDTIKPEACVGGIAGEQTLKLAYYRDGKSIGASQPDAVTKGIIVIHGLGAQPTKVRDPVWNDVKAAGLEPNTWVVAPYFIRVGDLNNVDADVLQWSNLDDVGYPRGDTSVLPSGAQVSSFDVLDAVIKRMKAKAPKITEFVIMGHSAGGQFVNRYSMGTRIEDAFPGVSFRYVISSPGAYTYLSNKRYTSDEKNYNSTEQNVTPPPYDTSACSGFNNYRYGLEGIPAQHYMTDLTPAEMKQRVASKKRLFIVANNDNVADAENCAESAQGANRRVRAFNYMHHLRVEKAAANAGFCVISGLTEVHTSKILGTSAPLFFWRDQMVDCSLDVGSLK